MHSRDQLDDRRYDEVAAESARLALLAFVRSCGTQEAAAERLRVKQPTIGRNIKPGNQPTLKVIIALAKATGLTVDRILGLDVNQPLPSPSVPEVTQTQELPDRASATDWQGSEVGHNS
jgi:hypothetical protein